MRPRRSGLPQLDHSGSQDCIAENDLLPTAKFIRSA
jgi:hypothetical protein